MIRLRDILTEFQYGEKLWADPAFASSSRKYRQFLDRIYNGELEPNTEEETAVFTAIKAYIINNDKDKLRPEMIDDLLALKREFPDMLDPKTAATHVTDVFRGMTVAIDALPGLIEKATNVYSDIAEDWILLSGIGTDIQSRSEGGFVSFATTLASAGSFAGGRSPIDRWPVITRTPYPKVAKRALWNPDFLTTLAGYDESEIWLIGQRIPVQDMYIWNPRSMGNRLPRETDIAIAALAQRGIAL